VTSLLHKKIPKTFFKKLQGVGVNILPFKFELDLETCFLKINIEREKQELLLLPMINHIDTFPYEVMRTLYVWDILSKAQGPDTVMRKNMRQNQIPIKSK
jgi:hypothetical protein